MDVFAHPALRDGMPNAVLEAMACGKAVIATPVGGALDILEDGKNGIAVNVSDADMLSKIILELSGNPDKREQLGKNARDLVIKRFTLEKELEANLVIYRSLGL
jgi:glycosyltransferase involved in cell wall biosynthesis